MPITPEVLALIDALDADDPETGEHLRKHFVAAVSEGMCLTCCAELDYVDTEAQHGHHCLNCHVVWEDLPDNYEPFTGRTRRDREESIAYWHFMRHDGTR